MTTGIALEANVSTLTQLETFGTKVFPFCPQHSCPLPYHAIYMRDGLPTISDRYHLYQQLPKSMNTWLQIKLFRSRQFL